MVNLILYAGKPTFGNYHAFFYSQFAFTLLISYMGMANFRGLRVSVRGWREARLERCIASGGSMNSAP